MDYPDQSEEPLLTPEQVAKQLVVEPSTLAVWRCTNRQALPFIKVGALVRYRRSDVLEFINSRVRCAA
jgi:excisionase family DNA binding protein